MYVFKFRTAIYVLIVFVFFLSFDSQAQGKDPSSEPRENMALLNILQGHWKMQVSITNDAGETWQEMPETEVRIESRQKQLMLSEIPLDTTSAGFHMETHLTYDQYRQQFRKAAIDDVWGVMDIYEGGIEGDNLIMSNLRSKTFFPVGENTWRAFKLVMELKSPTRIMEVLKSDDGGTTWEPAFRVTYTLISNS